MKKEEITTTADLQAIIPYESLPRMPLSLEGVSVADIPIKYMMPKPIYSANGFSIDMTPSDMRKMMSNCSATKPGELKNYKQKLQKLFEKPNEYA